MPLQLAILFNEEIMDSDKLDYFIKRTEKDLDEIKLKLDQLWNFKFMLLGGSAVVTFIVNLVFTIYKLNH